MGRLGCATKISQELVGLPEGHRQRRIMNKSVLKETSELTPFLAKDSWNHSQFETLPQTNYITLYCSDMGSLLMSPTCAVKSQKWSGTRSNTNMPS